MYSFINIKPFNKSVFIEYPSVVKGNTFLDYHKDRDTGDLTIWLGKLHTVVSPGYG